MPAYLRRNVPQRIGTFLLLSTLLMAACASAPTRSRSSASGTVLYDYLAVLPSDAVLRVELVELRDGGGTGSRLGEQAIEAPGLPPVPFAIEYDAKAVEPDGRYGVRAGVSVDDELFFLSRKPVPVLLEADATPVEVVLAAVGGVHDVGREDSMLARALQSELTQASPDGYESGVPLRAVDLLPEELLSGPHHRVRDRAISYGPQNGYWVDSDYGLFHAQGDSMLRRTVREIHAIAELEQLSRTKEFGQAALDSLTDPLVAAFHLVTNPVDTVTGVPRGAWSVWQTTTNAIGAEKSDYEDSNAESILALSKYKREYAGKLDVDVYSSNPVLQQELNRFGWLAVAGSWTPAFATAPIQVAAAPALTSLSWVDTLNDLITDQPPTVLHMKAEEKLEEIGIPADLRERFLSNRAFSPRHTTIIVACLVAMKDVEGRETLVAAAVQARSESEAICFQQIAELFSGYHRVEAPLVKLVAKEGAPPLGLSSSGSLVFCFPVDYGRWTPFSERLFQGLTKAAEERGAKGAELWIPGVVSERARTELRALGIKVSEKVGARFGLMD